ncbi:MAG: hypothetical protein RR614_13380, partial [Eubacterium sp.]
KWESYDPSNKPIVNKNFKGKVYINGWDKAGNPIETANGTNYATNTIFAENTLPEMTLEADKDTTAWQTEQIFTIKAKDTDSGIGEIKVEESSDGTTFKVAETYALSYNSGQRPDAQPSLTYQGTEPNEGQKIDVTTLPHGAVVTGEDGAVVPTGRNAATGLTTDRLSFSLKRITPSMNRNTPSQIRVTIIDRAGNAVSQTQSYKIDTAKPSLKVEQSTAGWSNESAKIGLSLSNEAGANQGAVDKTKTVSKVTYYYRVGNATANVGKPDGGFKKINETPAYGTVSFSYAENYNGALYFKAKSEVAVESVEVSTNVKIDKVNPKNTEVQVLNQSSDVDKNKPDGTRGWYKTLPTIDFGEAKLDIDGGTTSDTAEAGKQRSPITTFYQLDRDGV